MKYEFSDGEICTIAAALGDREEALQAAWRMIHHAPEDVIRGVGLELVKEKSKTKALTAKVAKFLRDMKKFNMY